MTKSSPPTATPTGSEPAIPCTPSAAASLPHRERSGNMVIGLIVGIVFIAGVLYFQHRDKDR